MAASSRFKALTTSAAAAGLAVAIGSGAYWSMAHADARNLNVSAGAPVVAGAPSFAPLIARVAPAVVSIDVERRGGREEVGLSDQQGQPFQFMFPFGGGEGGAPGADPFHGLVPQGRGPQQAPKERVTGSGFFISSDGYVVTNNHVVEGASTITVRLADKRQFKARLIGRDPATDLAVLKVDGGEFAYVSFEDQAKPAVGDWVVAVGNPYDLGGTATAGIVSALGRENVSGSSFVDYMQIDAPINRGNSGGPTFDTSGRVVGVNSAIYSPSGGSVGIGFAIPADVAQAVTRQLMAHGKVARGYIGATIQNITPDIASSLGLNPAAGALVADIVADGPSARAGLKPGDVVEAVDGQAVDSAASLTRRVALAQAGQDVRLKVLRDGRPLDLTIHAGVRPSEAQLASNSRNPGGDESEAPGLGGGSSVLGLQLGRLTDRTRQQFGLDDQRGGVVVEGVRPETDAQAKGLQPGDVILRAGTRAVSSPTDVSAAVAEARAAHRGEVLLLVARNGQNTFVPVKVADAQG